MSKFAVTFLLS